MKDFRTLEAWEKAHVLTVAMYRATAAFQCEQLYGITGQMRRASASIAANLAEGCGRSGDGDFHRFLNTAADSAIELEYFLLLARDLELMPIEVYDDLQKQVVEVQRVLSGLLRTAERARKNAILRI